MGFIKADYFNTYRAKPFIPLKNGDAIIMLYIKRE